ncbi:hypothetical protein GCM10022225_83270 [Plantactinospora mayteni]|uniref:SH3 domain-containing protein n=1 Tax=Plantactinospora mayteni TaxID=566021 RepID=A0ABQ4F4G1_9ACTN|nr:hypothetical protein [Plantactinospora mayteni]GIH01799.1 hypothetical protein Pma05_83710 [Plantactinospora mayteni]
MRVRSLLLATVLILLTTTGFLTVRHQLVPTANALPPANGVVLADSGYANLRPCAFHDDERCKPTLQPANGHQLIVWCAVTPFSGENSRLYGLGDYPLPGWFMVTDPMSSTTGFIHITLVHLLRAVPWCADQEGEVARTAPPVTSTPPYEGVPDPKAPEMINSHLVLPLSRSAGGGSWHAVKLRNYQSETNVVVRCHTDDTVVRTLSVHTDANGSASAEQGCYFVGDGGHWAETGIVQANPDTSGPAAAPTVTLAKGAVRERAFWYRVTVAGYPPNTDLSVLCHDTASPAGFRQFKLRTGADGRATAENGCFSGDGPDHWVTVGGVTSNHVAWGAASATGAPATTASRATDPPPPTMGSLSIGWSSAHPSWITITTRGLGSGTYDYTCHFGSGGDRTFKVTVSADPQTFDNGNTCYDQIPGDTVWLTIGSARSNTLTVAGPPPPPPPAQPTGRSETVGGVTHTWTNYTNAGGTAGPVIPAHQTVLVSCKTTGFRVANGNTWWYRIASPGWDNRFYASSDAFYNNGQTSGSLVGTPWVDPAVPDC